MNEQPFVDPANPPKPDLTSREKLTKQIEELQQVGARAVAENNPKGAAIALQQQLVLAYLLMIDELQSTQQMFERIDRRLDEMKGYITRPEATKSSTVTVPLGGPQVDPMTPEQRAAFDLVLNTLQQLSKQDNLAAMGSGLLANALVEYQKTFLPPKGV